MQNLCLGLNALFQGIEVVKHPFYSIGHKMMFRSVLVYFPNLRHVIRCKTCVLGQNALFLEIKVAKHPLYSIGPKMISGCVSEDFANLRQVKRCKTCVWAWMHYFGVPKLWSSILLHWTQNDVWECFGVFRKPSAWNGCKTCVTDLNALKTKVVKQPFYSIGPKMISWCVLEDFANLRQVKRCKTCV
jgi:hypothetical protein